MSNGQDGSSKGIPRRRPALIRIIRILKRRGFQQKDDPDQEHAKNERMMARWTRRLGVFTIVLAGCAALNLILIALQLGEMHSGGIDTHNLATAAHDQAIATGKLKGAGEAQAKALDKLRLAGEAQAKASEKLRQAGEAQAKAMEGLRGAGEAQAQSTAALAKNSGKQIRALTESADASRAQADSARAQAAAVAKSADAAIVASRSTDRLAQSGQSQANAVLQSLDIAKQANEIARQARVAADRPWVRISDPVAAAPSINTDYKITMPLINSGRSPGLKATATAAIMIYNIGDNYESLKKCENTCQVFTAFPTLQLGGVTTNYIVKIAAKDITSQLLSDIKTQKRTIIISTRVDYFDSDGQPHSSGSCNFLSTNADALGGFTACTIGNWAD